MLWKAIGRAGLCAALLALPSATALTTAATPDPAWRDAARLAIVCDVRLDRTGHEAVARALCGRIKRIAEEAAPVPVEVFSVGDLVRNSDGTVALLVHATVAPAASVVSGAQGELMTFSIRSTRGGAFAPDPAYFGAAPRVARYAPDSSGGDELEQALRAALTEVLPWLSTAERIRPYKRERDL